MDISEREYWEAIRKCDQAFADERDRRYAEVNVEKEKALKIKETADLAALQLAREIQTYKDEKANELREQIGSERGTYATKDDMQALREYFEALHKPVVEFMAGGRGERIARADEQAQAIANSNRRMLWLVVAISIVVILVNVGIALLLHH
jgi:hypothetical protein